MKGQNEDELVLSALRSVGLEHTLELCRPNFLGYEEKNCFSSDAHPEA